MVAGKGGFWHAKVICAKDFIDGDGAKRSQPAAAPTGDRIPM
jgi:hypothetical protein